MSLGCERRQIKPLHLLPRPGSSAQKRERGLHGRVALEAIDVDSAGQLLPAVVIDQSDDDAFQGQAMQGVFRLFGVHEAYQSRQWDMARHGIGSATPCHVGKAIDSP